MLSRFLFAMILEWLSFWQVDFAEFKLEFLKSDGACIKDVELWSEIRFS